MCVPATINRIIANNHIFWPGGVGRVPNLDGHCIPRRARGQAVRNTLATAEKFSLTFTSLINSCHGMFLLCRQFASYNDFREDSQGVYLRPWMLAYQQDAGLKGYVEPARDSYVHFFQSVAMG